MILYEIAAPGGTVIRRLRSLKDCAMYRHNLQASCEAGAKVFSYDEHFDRYVNVTENEVTFTEWLLLRRRNIYGRLSRCM